MKIISVIAKKLTKLRWFFVILFLIFLCGMYINSTTSFRLKLLDHYMNTQNYNKVITICKKILRKELLNTKYQTLDIEQISDIRFILANSLSIRNRFIKSAQILKQMLEINPTYKIGLFSDLSDSELYRKFALALLSLNFKDMALEQFQKAVELEPDSSFVYYQLALIYQRDGLEKKAITQFEKVVELADKPISQSINKLPAYLGDIYYNLALNLQKNGNMEKAKDYYKKAIDLDGNRIVGAYYNLKSIYEKQGNLKKANNIISNLLNLKPEYEVNHKFSDDLIFLGYSLNEKEFELFDKGRITFFWEVTNQNSELNYQKKKLSNVYKIGNRLYEVKEIKNLAPNFGFEVDSIGKGFPFGWDTDRYGTAVEYHEIISREDKGDTNEQCLLIIADPQKPGTSCTTSFKEIDENSYYLQSGWLKSPDTKAWMGREYGPEYIYNYAASNIESPNWKYFSEVITPPTGAKYVKLRVLLVSHSKEGKAYFDDVLFIKLELPELTKKE